MMLSAMSKWGVPYPLPAPNFHLTCPSTTLIAYSVTRLEGEVSGAGSATAKNACPFAVAGAVMSRPAMLVTHFACPDPGARLIRPFLPPSCGVDGIERVVARADEDRSILNRGRHVHSSYSLSPLLFYGIQRGNHLVGKTSTTGHGYNLGTGSGGREALSRLKAPLGCSSLR